MLESDGQMLGVLEPVSDHNKHEREEKLTIPPSLTDPVVDIPFSLPLLFLTAHVDVTLQTYHYRWNEAYVLNYETLGPWPPNQRPRRDDGKRPKILPKIKRNFVSVVQNAKHKVSRAFLCLPCVRNEECDSAYGLSVPTPSPHPSPKVLPHSVTKKDKEDQVDENEEIEEEEEEENEDDEKECENERGRSPLPDAPSSLPLKKGLTTSETVDSGFFSQDGSSLPTPTDSEKTFPSGLIREEEWAWVARVAAEGRFCFQEARALASGGRKEVQELRQSVATTQGRLHRAIAQLWLVESGLHDHVWELMDRETWTQFLVPTNHYPRVHPHEEIQFIDDPSATLADFLADDDGCVWEWSLV